MAKREKLGINPATGKRWYRQKYPYNYFKNRNEYEWFHNYFCMSCKKQGKCKGEIIAEQSVDDPKLYPTNYIKRWICNDKRISTRACMKWKPIDKKIDEAFKKLLKRSKFKD